MRLHDWIKGMGVSGAARQLGVSRQCIYNWLNGTRTPSERLKTRIARVTKGKVVPRRRRQRAPSTPKPEPYYVIRIPTYESRCGRDSLARRAFLEIDRGSWPIEYYPDRD